MLILPLAIAIASYSWLQGQEQITTSAYNNGFCSYHCLNLINTGLLVLLRDTFYVRVIPTVHTLIVSLREVLTLLMFLVTTLYYNGHLFL